MTFEQFSKIIPNIAVMCNTPDASNCYSKGTVYKIISTSNVYNSISTIDDEGELNGFHYSYFDIIPLLKKETR